MASTAALMTHQVKWVSGKGRYTTLSFASLADAQACKKRHEEYTGRPAHIVALPAASGANFINTHDQLMASLADPSLRFVGPARLTLASSHST